MHAILFVCCLSTRRSRIGKFMSDGFVADQPVQKDTMFVRFRASINYWYFVLPVPAWLVPGITSCLIAITTLDLFVSSVHCQ